MTAATKSQDTARQIYVTGLKNQHAVEKQAIELLERQVGRLESYPEMKARMQEHIVESRAQAHRIEELLSALGTRHSALKDTAMSIVGNLAAMIHTPAGDEVVKNSFANFAFEHYEIASYKALLVLCDAAGHAAAAATLQTSLDEEIRMAEWIDAHLKDTTLRFLQRKAAGEKAGV